MVQMMAVRVHELGAPGVLAWEAVERPQPGPGQVLVQVYATGVNPPDWYMRSGFAELPEELRPRIVAPFSRAGMCLGWSSNSAQE